MKGLVCLLLLLETFVCVVQHQVDGGLNEKELRSEDGVQNPPQTDTLRDEASTNSQQKCHLCFTDVHAALRDLTATVTEQKTNIRALEMRQMFILEELNKKNDDREIAFSASLMQSGSGYTGPFTTEITLTYRKVYSNIGNAYNPITGIFTAPLKGAYMFRISIHGHGPIRSAAYIARNGERVVAADDYQAKDALNSSNGVVLILEVGDVVHVRLWSGRRIYDDQSNYNTFSGFLLFPLR